jgi:hypothetical protein
MLGFLDVLAELCTPRIELVCFRLRGIGRLYVNAQFLPFRLLYVVAWFVTPWVGVLAVCVGLGSARIISVGKELQSSWLIVVRV